MTSEAFFSKNDVIFSMAVFGCSNSVRNFLFDTESQNGCVIVVISRLMTSIKLNINNEFITKKPTGGNYPPCIIGLTIGVIQILQEPHANVCASFLTTGRLSLTAGPCEFSWIAAPLINDTAKHVPALRRGSLELCFNLK